LKAPESTCTLERYALTLSTRLRCAGSKAAVVTGFAGCCWPPKNDGSQDEPVFLAAGGGGTVPDRGCGAAWGRGTGSAAAGETAATSPDTNTAINAAWRLPAMFCSATASPQIR
jgi:hypothetical protein